MTPVSLEEQIICYADLFYAKGLNGSTQPKSVAEIRRKLASFGSYPVRTFDNWLRLFQPAFSPPLESPDYKQEPLSPPE
jgi:uncharacterized protein